MSVRLHHYAASQVVLHQHLLRFSNAKLPGQPGMFDGRFGRCTRAATVSADQHNIGVSLGNPGGDGANAHLGHKLDVDPGLRINILQVMNELRQVFDGVDIVVRRRRYQLHSGRSPPHPPYVLIDFVAGELTSLSRLRTLRHFDLQVGSVHQIVGGNAKPPGSHLLHSAAPRVAVGIGSKATVVFSALTGIALGVYTVHSYGQGLVGLPADSTQRNSPRGKALHYPAGRLHLIQGKRLFRRLELQEPPQRAQPFFVFVGQFSKPPVHTSVGCLGGVLQQGNSVGIPHVKLAVPSPLIDAAHLQVQHRSQS